MIGSGGGGGALFAMLEEEEEEGLYLRIETRKEVVEMTPTREEIGDALIHNLEEDEGRWCFICDQEHAGGG
jgi:hypothetical protein